MTRSATANRDEQRTRPLVWVRELVLYESLDPVVEIRHIPFTTGLNIVQGEASETTDAFESGHGIGKTTLCRLIRYCLGEKTFGQRHVVAEVKHCLPAAHVGALIEVDGSEWAVLRPLGHRGKDKAGQGVSLLDLIAADEPEPYEKFTAHLEALALAGLPRRDILSSGQSIQWLHLLAMCSRDQESRYDRFWNWRHPRSESDPLKFKKPKVDAALCVRAILGLLDPAESELRAKLEQLEDALPRLRAEIKEKQAEPNFHITRLRNSLAMDFDVTDATNAPIGPDHLFGITQAVDGRMREFQRELAEIEEQLPPLDRQISLAAASLSELLELNDQQNAASEVTDDGTASLLNDLEKLRQQRQAILERESRLCVPGNLIVGSCNIVQGRLTDIERRIGEQQRATLPQVSEREQTAAELSAQASRQETPISQLRKRLDDLNRRKNELSERRRTLNGLVRQLPLVAAELRRWDGILQGVEPNTDLRSLEAKESKTQEDIVATRGQLNDVIARQAQRAKRFEARFNSVVQETVNNRFKGVVVIEEDGIEFRINREKSLFGEAYETLAVLLADLAMLAEGSSRKVLHPGVLIHDCPREADLNYRIYERLLDVAASLMQDAYEGDEIPFQYIVTTTTAPSQRLREESFTKLRLRSGSESLFKKQLEGPMPDVQTTLFASVEGE